MIVLNTAIHSEKLYSDSKTNNNSIGSSSVKKPSNLNQSMEVATFLSPPVGRDELGVVVTAKSHHAVPTDCTVIWLVDVSVFHHPEHSHITMLPVSATTHIAERNGQIAGSLTSC